MLQLTEHDRREAASVASAHGIDIDLYPWGDLEQKLLLAAHLAGHGEDDQIRRDAIGALRVFGMSTETLAAASAFNTPEIAPATAAA